MSDKKKIIELKIVLNLILDCVDYDKNNCKLNSMIGAILPLEIIQQARKILE